MRILYVITRAVHGGAQSHVFDLATEASKRGEVIVACGEDGPLGEQLRDAGLRFEVMTDLKHPVHLWHDMRGVKEICRLIRQFDPDVVHAHSGKAGVVARLAACFEHVPSVYTAHGFLFGQNAGRLARAVSLAGEWVGSRAGDWTIAVSRSEARLARHYRIADGGRMTVIANGVTAVPHRARPQLSPPVIAMAARFAYPKQQELLIRAFSRVPGNAHLWLIGDGPAVMAAWAAARRSDARNRIVFWNDRNDVRELLAQAQVAALISDSEGFGLSLVEAMSVGLPVIASDCGGMSEIVEHGLTGELVRCGDEHALGDAIYRLVSNAELRTRMGAAGYRRYRENFTTEQMMRRTFEVYGAVLGAGSGLPEAARPERGYASGD